MQTGIRDWGDAVWTSLVGAMAMFLAGIPKIIGFVVILIIGWFIVSLIEKGVAALFRMVKFKDLAARSGFGNFVSRMGIKTDSLSFIALIVLVAVFNALGLPTISGFLSEMLLWLPNLVVALIVLVIGGLAAGALSSLVRGAASRAELSNPGLLATITSVAVWLFAIDMAINQIEIVNTLVNTLFMVMVGALALALALALRLSGRETAAGIMRGWHEKGKQAISEN